MLNLKKWITNVNNKLHAIGTVYTASWTATSSSAANTQLTGSISLPAGTYIVVLVSPVLSAQCAIGFAGITAVFGQNGDSKTSILTVTTTTTVLARSGQSASVNFTYTERGFLKAVRIA